MLRQLWLIKIATIVADQDCDNCGWSYDNCGFFATIVVAVATIVVDCDNCDNCDNCDHISPTYLLPTDNCCVTDL